MAKRGRLLVAISYNRPEDFEALRRYADIYWLDKMDRQEMSRVLPSVDCIYSHGWPSALEPSLPAMKSLRLYQAGNAGVNGVKFGLLGEGVTVCSNAGGYSDEVAEFAIGLMLAGGKGIVKFDRALRSGTYERPRLGDLGLETAFFRGKTLGIVGYGGIGRATARLARAFGMTVMAFGRHKVNEGWVRPVSGRRGPLE